MFYNDVIKALECCINADCDNCPRCSKEWFSGMCSDNDFLSDVLDFINRQNEEIDIHKFNLDLAYDAVFYWYDKYNELLREIEREQKDVYKR